MIENNYINGIKITLDSPYISIENSGLKETSVALLQIAFAGNISELSAINTYIYQYLSTSNQYKEISKAIEKIAITEMKHLDIIGKLLINSNVTPYYGFINNKNNLELWNGAFVNYEKNIIKLLKNNIHDEIYSINLYKKIIELENNENIENIFNRIIEDEENHVRIFKSILNQFV